SRLLGMVGSSDLLAAGTQLGQDRVDAVLVDGAHGSRGNAQLHPAVLAGDPEPALVQVREEAAAGLVVGVRDVVAGLHALAGDLANSGHNAPRWRWVYPMAWGTAAPAGPRGHAMRCGSVVAAGQAPDRIPGRRGAPGGQPDAASQALCRPAGPPASRRPARGRRARPQRGRRRRSRTPSRASRSL